MTPGTKQRSAPSNDIGAVRAKVAANPNLDPELVAKRMQEFDSGPKEQVLSEDGTKKTFGSVPKELKGLEDLIFLGAGTKDITFGDFTFQVATLSAKEQEIIFRSSLSIKEEKEKYIFYKKALLASSIRRINGRPLASYFDEDSFSFESKIALVETFQSNLFELLFEELEKLISDTGKLLTAENLKK